MYEQPALIEKDKPSYSASTFPPPRPFQVTAHEKLRQGFRDGHKNQVIMAATGAGKAYLGMRICHEALLRGKRAVFACDRITLINQLSQSADDYGLTSHGVIQAGHWRTDLTLPFQIASIQTLARRGFPETDVLVWDECHSAYAPMLEYAESGKSVVIGLTATPFAKGMGKTFSNLINAATMHDLTEQGILVPMRVFSCAQPDMTGAATAGGEWTDKAAAERGMDIIGDVVTEWLRHASTKKTIVFGATIAHCEEICRQFNEAGIMAAVFCSKTPDGERIALLNEYRKIDSALRVLVSVECLAKGFDVADVECVCDCRPLRKSLSAAIQMWGRGLRCSPNTGKTHCVLLDFSGNIIRFAEDYSDIFYNGLDKLDDGEKLDKEIRKDDEEKPGGNACPSCGFKPFAKRCIACGFEKSAQNTIEHLPGELQEIRIGKTKYAEDAAHLWAQVVTHARLNSAPEKQYGRAWHLFKDISGREAPRGFRIDGVKMIAITPEVAGKIRSMQIRFAKGKAKGAR